MSYRQFSAALDAFDRFAREIQALEGEPISGDTAQRAQTQISIVETLRSAMQQEYVSRGVDPRVVDHPEAEILRRPRATIEMAASPVFMIGHRRSGTTLLANLLHTSDRIAALPETFLASELVSTKKLHTIGHRLARRLGEPFPRFMARFAILVDSVYRDHMLREFGSGKQRWVSKELFASDQLDALDAMFDYRAQFLYVVRHGFNVAYSCSATFPTDGELPSSGTTSLKLGSYVEEWVSNNEQTMDFVERNSDRCLVVRYEDLIQEPSAVMRRVFDFLQEPTPEDSLNRLRERGPLEGAMGDTKILKTGGIIDAEDRKYWTSWPPALVAQLARKANPTLRRLGYPTE